MSHEHQDAPQDAPKPEQRAEDSKPDADADAPKPAEPTGTRHPIFIVVMGVAGTGKTTLARALQDRLGWPYIEGDSLHPAANIAKMSAGVPLTDADREPWLELIRTTAEHTAAEHQAKTSTSTSTGDGEGPTSSGGSASASGSARTSRWPGVLATCSALRGYYRDVLRGTRAPPGLQLPAHLAPPAPDRLPAYFVYIKGDRDLLWARISQREGHYMKPAMLDSQLRTLESPEGEDGVVVVPLDATTEEQADVAIRELNKLLPEPL